MSSAYPKTKQEWWKNVEDNWDYLLNILNKFLPMNSYEHDFKDYFGKDLLTCVLEFKSKRDPILVRVFEGAWGEAPDDSSIHSIPAWGILCGLCSESYLLYEGGGRA